MKSQNIKDLEKEYTDELKRRGEELTKYPLSAYSTSQLKAELRRRKRGEE